MTLQETLRQLKAASRAKMPAEAATIVARATERLEQSGIVKMTLKAGARAPDFSLRDAHGTLYDSNELLARGPLILTFYRGSW